MNLPDWLSNLRRAEVTNVVRDDVRTQGSSFLGVPRDRIFNEVIGGGQADFDQPWEDLSPDDRVLLYAYLNQLGHLEELLQAFTMLFAESKIENPIVIDLGCGPFTGGLALAAALGSGAPFSYIGVDRSLAMQRLGEKLAHGAEQMGALKNVERKWVQDLSKVTWSQAAGWRPVIVIVSYLLASTSLDASAMVEQMEALLARLGRGPVTVLYTNSVLDSANRSFPQFRAALEKVDFKLILDDKGKIEIERWGGTRERDLRYALFQRQKQNTLKLGGK